MSESAKQEIMECRLGYPSGTSIPVSLSLKDENMKSKHVVLKSTGSTSIVLHADDFSMNCKEINADLYVSINLSRKKTVEPAFLIFPSFNQDMSSFLGYLELHLRLRDNLGSKNKEALFNCSQSNIENSRSISHSFSDQDLKKIKKQENLIKTQEDRKIVISSTITQKIERKVQLRENHGGLPEISDKNSNSNNTSSDNTNTNFNDKETVLSSSNDLRDDLQSSLTINNKNSKQKEEKSKIIGAAKNQSFFSNPLNAEKQTKSIFGSRNGYFSKSRVEDSKSSLFSSSENKSYSKFSEREHESNQNNNLPFSNKGSMFVPSKGNIFQPNSSIFNNSPRKNDNEKAELKNNKTSFFSKKDDKTQNASGSLFKNDLNGPSKENKQGINNVIFKKQIPSTVNQHEESIISHTSNSSSLFSDSSDLLNSKLYSDQSVEYASELVPFKEKNKNNKSQDINLDFSTVSNSGVSNVVAQYSESHSKLIALNSQNMRIYDISNASVRKVLPASNELCLPLHTLCDLQPEKFILSPDSTQMIIKNKSDPYSLAFLDSQSAQVLKMSNQFSQPIKDFTLIENNSNLLAVLTNNVISIMDSRISQNIVSQRQYKTNYNFDKIKAFSESEVLVGSLNCDLRFFSGIYYGCSATNLISNRMPGLAERIIGINRTPDRRFLTVATDKSLRILTNSDLCFEKRFSYARKPTPKMVSWFSVEEINQGKKMKRVVCIDGNMDLFFGVVDNTISLNSFSDNHQLTQIKQYNYNQPILDAFYSKNSRKVVTVFDEGVSVEDI